MMMDTRFCTVAQAEMTGIRKKKQKKKGNIHMTVPVTDWKTESRASDVKCARLAPSGADGKNPFEPLVQKYHGRP